MKLNTLCFLLLCSQFSFAQPFIEIPASQPFEGVTNGAVGAADVDGDGDLDLLITGEQRKPVIGDKSPGTVIAKLYLNDGAGNYSEKSDTPFRGVTYSAIAFADVEGDGDQDVVIAGYTALRLGISTLYLNDGQGNFSVSEVPLAGFSHGDIRFATIDGDEYPDLLQLGFIGLYAFASVSFNDGAGNFMPRAQEQLSFEGAAEGDIATADVDGDGDLDVLITGRSDHWNESARLYLNQRIPTSVNERLEPGLLNFRVYPNPVVAHTITVEYPTRERSSATLRLFDLSGQLMLQQTASFGFSQQFRLSLPELSAGLYLLQVDTGVKVGVQKIWIP